MVLLNVLVDMGIKETDTNALKCVPTTTPAIQMLTAEKETDTMNVLADVDFEEMDMSAMM